MFNKHLRPVDTTIFINRLRALLEYLKTQYREGSYQTQEDVIEEFLRSVKEFYTDLQEPFLKIRPALIGTSPKMEDFNKSFEELGWDLTVGFQELDTLEKLVLRNFNYMVSERDKLNKYARRINSKSGDYVLYVEDPIGNTIYFKDSFNDASKIDFGSTLLSAKQCEIDQAEGIITLPIIRDGNPTKKECKVRLGNSSSSDGSAGNYQEVSAARHDTLDDILDGNPDSWYEFERVKVSRDDFTDSLRLDLMFYFDTPQIINHVRINPNNFGTQTQVRIETIDTSMDMNTWISIKDDIPIADFLQEDEENVFTLAPSTSKYAGQGFYTFTPRKVKYIHIVLEQDSSYEINTANGYRWRQAIGIRDIEAHALQYETSGDLISLPYVSPVEIQKVSLLASENPTEASELSDIVHQISVDDGSTWHSIQPQDRSGTLVPEIISINTEDEGSLVTASPVYEMRHRMLLNRDVDKFKEGSATLAYEIRQAVDLTGMPAQSPIQVQLSRSPITDTVKVLNPHFGVRALFGLMILHPQEQNITFDIPRPSWVGRSDGHSGSKFHISLEKELGSGLLDLDDIVIWVDNDTSWQRVASFSSSTSTDKHYTLDLNGTLIFGDGEEDIEDRKGFVPAAGAYVGFTLTHELLQLSASSPYVATLDMATDGEKSNVTIIRIDPPVIAGDYTKPGATVHRLSHGFISGYSFPNSESEALTFQYTGSQLFNPALEQAFINGTAEFQPTPTAGMWSCDHIRGVLYSVTSAPDGDEGPTYISYSYNPWIELANNEWDFVKENNPHNQKIIIKDSRYKAIPFAGDLVAGKRYLSLGITNIVPGSFKFTGSPFQLGNSSIREVAFIDGIAEFQSINDQGISTIGWYAIDYKNGLLYVNQSDTTNVSGDPGGFTCEYTSYTVFYNMAKYVEEEDFTVDQTSKTITIKEEKAIKIWASRDIDIRQANTLKIIYDYVHTTRESIEELEKYFTPIVRDIVLKVLPRE